ncbi:MAG: hypothetical protein LBR16_07300 [Treponema sp.]|jgi:hypothetical protein|nr:hypothetical protein [Treponema sp.]
MKQKSLIKGTSIMLLLVLLSGCVSTTMMHVNATEPNGRPVNDATVLVNGEMAGVTPNASTEVSNFVGTAVEISVAKDGYFPSKTEAVNVVFGLLLNIFAFFWASGPKAQQNVILIPDEAAAGEDK